MRRWFALAFLLAACSKVTFPAGDQFSPPAVPGWAHQARFAITDNRSDTLSFVTDTSAIPQLLGNMPVGDEPLDLEGPHHLAASPDGKYIYFNLSNYVPGSGSGPHGSHGLGTVPGSLVKLDAASCEKIAQVDVDPSPGDVILSTDGTIAYVTHYDLTKVATAAAAGGPVEAAYSALAIIDTTKMVRLAKIPLCETAHGEGLSADGKTLYVTCAQGDQLAIVDVSQPSAPVVMPLVPIGPTPSTKLGAPPVYGPYALSVSPVDGTVWISDNNSEDVRVFDPARMKMDPMRVIPVGGIAMFSDFSSDGKTIYVPHQGDDKITAIDTATLATSTLALPPDACLNVHAIKIAPDGQHAIAVCEGDHLKTGSVVSLLLTPFVVQGSVQVGVFPDGAAWLPPAPNQGLVAVKAR